MKIVRNYARSFVGYNEHLGRMQVTVGNNPYEIESYDQVQKYEPMFPPLFSD